MEPRYRYLEALDIQNQLAEWQARNFGPVSLEQLVLGVVEEWGETLSATTGEDWDDGIADTMIYLSQIFSLFHKPLPEAPNQTPWQGNGYQALGKLAHAALKYSQGIRGVTSEDVERAAETVWWVVVRNAEDRDPLTGFIGTAKRVMERDWVKYPKNGKTE